MFPRREPSEVGGLAAAGRRVAEADLQVDGGDRPGHITPVGLIDHSEVHAFGVGDLARSELLERRWTENCERSVLEVLDDRDVARGLEAVDHVVHRGVVSR